MSKDKPELEEMREAVAKLAKARKAQPKAEPVMEAVAEAEPVKAEEPAKPARAEPDPERLADAIRRVDPAVPISVGAFSEGQRRYLEYHRENVLRLAVVRR